MHITLPADQYWAVEVVLVSTYVISGSQTVVASLWVYLFSLFIKVFVCKKSKMDITRIERYSVIQYTYFSEVFL
jgi:hypothetical protein